MHRDFPREGEFPPRTPTPGPVPPPPPPGGAAGAVQQTLPAQLVVADGLYGRIVRAPSRPGRGQGASMFSRSSSRKTARRSSSKKTASKKTKSSQKKSASRSSRKSRYNSKAWMAKIRKLAAKARKHK